MRAASSLAVSLLFAMTALFAPARAPASETPPPPFMVHLTSGDSIPAVTLKPSSIDVVHVVAVDGKDHYIASNRIQSVKDATGLDRTREVVERRRTLGPEEVSSSGSNDGAAEGKPHHSLCWRGKPECASFLVTELGVLYRMDEYPFSGMDWRVALTFDLGYMKTLSPKTAVGATGYALLHDDITRLGIRPRYRRWLSRDISIDISPGILLGGEDSNADYDPPGFVFGVTGNMGDLVALTLETEYSRYRVYNNIPPDFSYYHTSDWTIRGGAKLGSGLGLAGGAAYIGLLILVLASGAAE